MNKNDFTLLTLSRCTVQVPCHLEQDCLGEGGLVVDPAAPLPVSTGSCLEEEGAVDLILLGSEDARKVFSHAGSASLKLEKQIDQ